MNEAIEVPDKMALESQSKDLVVIGRAIRIDTLEDKKLAALWMNENSFAQKQIEGKIDPILRQANATVSSIRLFKASLIDPLKGAYEFVRNQVEAFNAREERIRLVEQARIDEERREAERKVWEAREAAEKAERDHLQAIENAMQAELKAKEEKLTITKADVIQAELAGFDDIAALMEAEEAKQASIEAQQAADEARAQLTRQSFILAPKEKVAGLTDRTTWHMAIMDETLVPREYCIPDLARLRKMAVDLKDKAPDIPGVRFYPVTNSVRSGRLF